MKLEIARVTVTSIIFKSCFCLNYEMKGKRVSCMVNENLLNFELLMLILTLN